MNVGQINTARFYAELEASALGPRYQGMHETPEGWVVVLVEPAEGDAEALAALRAAHDPAPDPPAKTAAELQAENEVLLEALASLQARVDALEGI